jgi:ATP dependent DNA ligase domain
LSRFDDLRRREAAHKATLYAFDLIEHDGQDLRDLPFLDRKAALARLLRDTEAGILLNEHIAEDGMTVFAHACRLGAEGIVSKRVDGTCRSGPCAVWIKVRNPASIAVQRERSGTGSSARYCRTRQLYLNRGVHISGAGVRAPKWNERYARQNDNRVDRGSDCRGRADRECIRQRKNHSTEKDHGKHTKTGVRDAKRGH